MNDQVSIPDLTSRAMLCYVQVRLWSARKLDKKQTLKAIEGAGATADAARVNKHLLANADDALKNIQRKANAIRDYIDANTLPWDDAGNRLLSNEQALVVVGKAKILQDEFTELVNEFVNQYPILRAQALHNLGDMANDEDYPQPDVVRSKFGVTISFNPLPSGFGDIRVGMSEQQASAWQRHFEGNVKRQMNAAIMSAWDRLRENLVKYSDRLKLKDGEKAEIFRDSMVTNLRETCALLASLNVFGDPELDRVVAMVNREIAVYEPDQLRNSRATAEHVKGEVDAVLANLKTLFGE